jgi:hypothetical protein
MEEIYEKQLNMILNIQEKGTSDEKVLRIEGTYRSPFIFLDPKTGRIIIKGTGTPEDPYDFFSPVLNFIDREFANLQSIEVHFMLPYFSSSFGKYLLDLFIKLRTLYKRNIKVTCFWYYDKDDYDALEAGEDFESHIGIPFVMIEIPD